MRSSKLALITLFVILSLTAVGCGTKAKTTPGTEESQQMVIPTAEQAAQSAAVIQPLTAVNYRGGAARAGAFIDRGPVENAALLWQFEGAAASASPILVGTTVIFGTGEGITAVDSRTGSEVWRFAGSPVSAAPAYWDGTLYAASENGAIYALNPLTGQQLWAYASGGPVFSAPAVDESGVYFGSMDGFFYALNPKTGQELWKFAVGGTSDPAAGIIRGFRSAPALSGSTLVFASSQSGGASAELSLYAVDKASGTLLWEYSDWNQLTAPAVADGVVYFGGFGSFIGLNLQDGSPVLRVETDIVLTAPAVAGGLAFFGCDVGFLYAVDLRSGEIKWRFNSGSPVVSAPAVSGNMVYFGSGSGTFYGLDIPSGQAMWIFETGARIASSPLIAENAVFFSSDAGTVYALK